MIQSIRAERTGALTGYVAVRTRECSRGAAPLVDVAEKGRARLDPAHPPPGSIVGTIAEFVAACDADARRLREIDASSRRAQAAPQGPPEPSLAPVC